MEAYLLNTEPSPMAGPPTYAETFPAARSRSRQARTFCCALFLGGDFSAAILREIGNANGLIGLPNEIDSSGGGPFP